LRTIRWGIIGCGDVTEVKSGPALQKARNSELVAVMRRNGEKAKDYALRHGVPKWFDNAEGLIDAPEVDAVYVATPPSSHMEYTIRAARARKPVYVEKPMARTFEECQAMIETCATASVPLFVAYYRRALPRFLRIKELLDSREIGEVRFVTVTLYQRPDTADLDRRNLPWRVTPEISGGGKFLDLASHMLDFLAYVLGPIEKAQGIASNQGKLYPAEDIVSGNFRFESGVQGIGVWCFTAFNQVDLTEIVGAKGKIAFATFDSSPVVLTTGNGREEFTIENPPHIQQPLIQTIVDELNGMGNCPSTGVTGSRTNWVMDQMLKRWRRSTS
jgi:predicted dehydrogenase